VTDILIVCKWPTLPSGGRETELTSGYRRAKSEDGNWWLVREKGLFKRWHWLPVNGQFVSLQEVLV
jgi:hypothetical protein